MNEPVDPSKVEALLPDWASHRTTLKDIKGYSDDELFAIAHTAYFFLMQGKNDEARTLFEGLVAIDPRNDYYYRALGVVFHKLGDGDRALKQFGYALQLNPKSVAALVNRAEIYLSGGQKGLAQNDLDTALLVAGPKDATLVRKAKAMLRYSFR